MPKTSKRAGWKKGSYKKRGSYSKAGYRAYGAQRGFNPRRDMILAAPGVGVGRCMETKLRTCIFAQCQANMATGVFTGSLNIGSCFNPFGTIAAIQPALFDQWAVMFARYMVKSAELRIRICGSGGTSGTSLAGTPLGVPWVAASYPTTTLTPVAADFQAAASQPFAKQTRGYGCTPIAPMVHKLDAAYILGRTVPCIPEDNGALVGANPASGENMVVQLFINCAVLAQPYYTVELDLVQTVWFDQRIQVDTE